MRRIGWRSLPRNWRRSSTPFYRDCRVIDSDNLALSRARLQLVLAAKLVLARCLSLMGMSAPDHM